MTHARPEALHVESRLRVRYAETDQMKVVYHSNYIVWMEVGRVEFFRHLGFTYREMEQEGYHLPVAEVKCRYKQSAMYDDEIIIRTHIANLRGSMLRFGYEVLRADDRALLAEGESTHFIVGADMQPTTFPEKFGTILRRAQGE